MTKQFLFLSLIAAFLLVFTGCGTNPEKTLPSKDGKWNMSGTYTITISATGLADQVSTGNISGTAVFTETTIATTSNGTTDNGTWSYADDKITVTSGSDVAVYTVTSASSKKEVWHHDETVSQTVLGITQSVHTVQDLTFTR